MRTIVIIYKAALLDHKGLAMTTSHRRLMQGAATWALALASIPTAAAAQSAATPQTPREALPTVVVTDPQATGPAYQFGDPIDSGLSRFDARSVETRAPGSGDAIDILRRLPNTQFAIERGTRVDEDSLRDLRPEMISISGGRPTDNLFTLDGIGANSLFEMSTPGSRGTSPAHFEDVAGVSAQSIFIDTNLIGGISVRDSNVSAEFGRFTGGVVEIVTREPARRYGVQGSVGYTGSDLTSFKVPDSFTGARPEEPEYSRYRWSLSADLPINERLGLLVAYNQSRAESTYHRGASYGGGAYGSESLSENYLVKALYELPDGMRLTAQVTHAPYRSEFEGQNGIRNRILTHGGGTTAKLSLDGVHGAADWKLELNHAWSDMDREAPQYNFSRPAGGSVNWCAASSCTEGGFGDINQSQHDTTVLGRWNQPLGGGDLRLGFDYDRIQAQKQRPEENRAYQRGTYDVRTACASPTDLACVAGEHALTRYISYQPFDFDVGIDAVSLWGEYTRDWVGITVRAGLRYDYESFLGNHNLSPRLSVSRALPWWGITATAGLNRYYGRSFLSYAVREKRPSNLTYERTGVLTGGKLMFSENWRLTTVGTPATYRNADLDTPYNDEATLAFTGPAPLIGGEWRVKGVYREGHDLITSSTTETLTYDDVGRPRTYRVSRATNEGQSEYAGGSVQYLRTIGRHGFTFSTSFSKTKSNAVTEYDIDEEEELGATLVVHNGQIVSLLDVARQNDRFDYASPFVASLDWSSRWVDDRLSLNVAMRYRGGFDRIEDTGVNERIGGVNYDVYGLIEYDPSVDVDLNASFDLVRENGRQAAIEARVSNLFDTVPYKNIGFTTNPYQLGRVVWVGVNFRY